MSHARALTLGIAALGLVAATTVATAPDAAADSSVVVHGPGDWPLSTSQGTTQFSCDDPGAETGVPFSAIHLQRGPDPVPLGERTWGFDADHEGVAEGPYRDLDSLGDLAPTSLQVYADADTDGVAWVWMRTGDDDLWFGSTPLSVAAGGWRTITQDATTTYSWVERHNDGTPVVGGTFSGTVGQTITHVGGGPFAGEVGFGLGCNAAGRFDIDDFEAGPTGDVITYDLEGNRTRTRIHGSRHVVTAGRPVVLRGLMSIPNSIITRADLVLEAKPFGSHRWHSVGTATQTWDGQNHPAVRRERPQLRTAYRYHWLETTGSDGSVSSGFVVRVHAAVSAHPAARHVHRGAPIFVVGRVQPDKRGHRVTLWRGHDRLASARVRADGTYTVRARAASRGDWRLRVRIARTPGNLAGRSTPVTVHVA